MDHQSAEDALRRRGRERDRETPGQREARLSQRRLRDRERAYCVIGNGLLNTDCVIGNGQGNASPPKQRKKGPTA